MTRHSRKQGQSETMKNAPVRSKTTLVHDKYSESKVRTRNDDLTPKTPKVTFRVTRATPEK